MKKHFFVIAITFVGIAIFMTTYWTARLDSSQRSGLESSQSQQQAAGSVFEYARLVVNGDQVTWLVGGQQTPRSTSINVALNEFGARSQRGTLANLLNAIGADGWELVVIDGETWTFKKNR